MTEPRSAEGDAPAVDSPRSHPWLVMPVGILLLLFVVYTAATIPLHPTVQRGAFLLAIVFLGTFLHPMPRKFVVWDLAVLIGASASIGYLVLNWEAMAYRAQYEPQIVEYILGCVVVVVVLEVTRRTIGWALPIVALGSLMYAYFGYYLPEPFTHRGYNLARLLANQYLTHEGLFGSLLGISVNLIAIFVLFGCLMTHVGLGDVLMAVARRISGERGYGAPAKLAVVSSALFGTISGSSTSNVVATGTTTIPLMKKYGFAPEFAGAVEAVASTGGQIMPPVMGVAAFLVADITGIPYAKIMVAAVIPAVLYYAALFIEVHMESMRLGLRGVTRSAEMTRSDLFKIFLLLPIVLLVYLLMQGYSPAKAALFATILLVVLSAPSGWHLVERGRLKELLRIFVYAMVTVGLACATAGIVIGALNISGATLRLSYVLIELAGDSRFLLLVATAVLTLILGCGLPTVAAYAVAASFAAPTLVMAKFGLLQAHMFVFYFACLSSVTPPVAIAAYAAAGLAGAPPMRVGLIASKLAIAGFIVPFMYVWGNSYFIGYADFWSLLEAAVAGLVGVALLAFATIGFVWRPITVAERLGYLGGAMCFLYPSILADLAGALIGAVLLLINAVLLKRRPKNAVRESTSPSPP